MSFNAKWIGPCRRVFPRLRPGFTLVELLVVVGIIGLMVAIILPTVGRIRAAAQEAQCGSHQRALAQAFIAFATDNNGRLPGNFFDGGQVDPRRRSWLFNHGEPFTKAPRAGTIWKYVNDEKIYRCPALEAAPVGGGSGSNGLFDYVAFIAFTGARLSKVSGAETKFTNPDGSIVTGLAAPLICEEDPLQVNGSDIDPAHGNWDRMTHAHRGGSLYAPADGSVRWFREPQYGNAGCWIVRAPSGKWVSLGVADPPPMWGWWDGQ